MSTIVCRVAVLTVSLFIVTPHVWAQGSISSLVEPRNMEFGVIATGADAEKLVTITNTTKYPLRLSHTSTGCVCAEVRPKEAPPSNIVIPSGETYHVRVGINTFAFKQQRNTSVTLHFVEPFFEDVRIPIAAYIRTDVVFTPGKLDFGQLEPLSGGTANIRIQYAGRPNWTIRSVKSSNDEILSAEIAEISRNANGQVEYALKATLDSKTPVGRIREQLTLVTDDATNPYVPLMVEGAVVADISLARSEHLFLRPLKPGETARIPMIITGKKPFAVQSLQSKVRENCFRYELSEDEKKVHQVQLEFTAPDEAGKFSEEVQVKIKGREETLRFSVKGTVTGS